MTKPELVILTDLSISNLTCARLDDIYKTMSHKSKAELCNSIRNYVSESHTADEVETKQERLLAAIMAPIFQYEQAKVKGGFIMDDLIDELIDLFFGYAEAKKELAKCVDDCAYDAGYFCQQESQHVDRYREDIKTAIKKLIKL